MDSFFLLFPDSSLIFTPNYQIFTPASFLRIQFMCTFWFFGLPIISHVWVSRGCFRPSSTFSPRIAWSIKGGKWDNMMFYCYCNSTFQFFFEAIISEDYMRPKLTNLVLCITKNGTQKQGCINIESIFCVCHKTLNFTS